MFSKATQGPMLPSHQYHEFLSRLEAAELLKWALENRSRFEPAKLTGQVYDPTLRRALKLEDLGPHRPVLVNRLLERLPDIFRDTGTRPFEPDLLEIELAAHGEGAFFKTHSDISFGIKRETRPDPQLQRHDRLVSAVYYMHRKPKGFSGGTLRVYRIGDKAGEGDFKEFQPDHNSLVAFPSWAFHEVQEVRSPGDQFENWRFAVNMWVCRRLDDRSA